MTVHYAEEDKARTSLDLRELENRYRKAKNPVLRSHYQILWLISEGKTTREVMEVTGYSRAGSKASLSVRTPMARGAGGPQAP